MKEREAFSPRDSILNAMRSREKLGLQSRFYTPPPRLKVNGQNYQRMYLIKTNNCNQHYSNDSFFRVASNPMVKCLFLYNTQLNLSKLVFYVILCLQGTHIWNYLYQLFCHIHTPHYQVSNIEYKEGNSRH